MDTIPGHPQIFVHPTSAVVGAWSITGIDVAHDEDGGRSRGKNTIIVLDDGDVRLVHLGDLGHALTPETVAAIGPVDVLMIPVGGYFTIDHTQAAEVVEALVAEHRHPHALQDSQGGLPHLRAGAVPGHAGHRRAPGHIDHRDHPGHLAARTSDIPSSSRQIRTVISPTMEDTPKPRPAAKQPVKKAAKPVKRGRILRMKPGPLRNLVILIIVVIVVFVIGSIMSRIWTNYWWYAELGQKEVFWTPFLARLCVGLFFAVVFFGIFYGSLWLARKISPRLLPMRNTGDNVLELKVRRRWPGRLLLLAAVVVAIIVGAAYSSRWEEILLFLNRTSFGYADPLFGKDASFFVFTLPVWKMLVDFVGIAILLTFIATALTYVADRALVLNERNRLSLAPHVKAHLSVLLAIAMVAKAGDYMIQSWSLVYSDRGAVMGASYTDVHASLPVLHFLAIVSLVAAVIFVANIRYRGWRLPAIAIAVMFLTWALAGKAYPAIIQSYKVSPNEVTAESPYIANNIEATRFAFGLDKVASASNPASTDLTAEGIKSNEPTLESVRLWEPRPALDTYQQIQEIRLYYAFTDIDVDRYTVDGEYRQVLISGRELDQNQAAAAVQELGEPASHLHPRLRRGDEPRERGQSATASRSYGSRTSRRAPQPTSRSPGRSSTTVNWATTTWSSRPRTPSSTMRKGIRTSLPPTRAPGACPSRASSGSSLFAFRFRTAKLLFSSSFTDESRIMYQRTIQERVQALAPFLSYDRDPYLVLRDDGSLVWMWDAYTTSDRFPYSQKHDQRVQLHP